MLFRQTPPSCPICGAAHTGCTAGDRQRLIVAVQLPARDAVKMARPQQVAEVTLPALGDGSDGRPFSTATYRGKKKTR